MLQERGRDPMRPLYRVLLRSRLSHGAATLLLLALTSGLAMGLHAPFGESVVVTLYLVPVLIAAVALGLRAGLLAAALAVGLLNFLFAEPQYTFLVRDMRDLVTLGVFLLVAAITGLLAGGLREARDAAETRAGVMRILAQSAEALHAAATREEVLGHTAQHLGALSGGPVLVLVRAGAGFAMAPLRGEPSWHSPPEGATAPAAAWPGPAAAASVAPERSQPPQPSRGDPLEQGTGGQGTGGAAPAAAFASDPGRAAPGVARQTDPGGAAAPLPPPGEAPMSDPRRAAKLQAPEGPPPEATGGAPRPDCPADWAAAPWPASARLGAAGKTADGKTAPGKTAAEEAGPLEAAHFQSANFEGGSFQDGILQAVSLQTEDLEAADRALRRGRLEPAAAQGWNGSAWSFLPIKAAGGAELVFGYRPAPPRAREDCAAAIEVLQGQCRLALERLHLAAEARDESARAESGVRRAALLSSLSHDLRTPLAVILGGVTTVIEFGAVLPAEARHQLLETVEQETRRLSAYVGDMLQLTRLQSGAALVPGWADASEAARAAALRLRRLYPQTSVLLDLPPLPMIRAEAGLIEQAVYNLLDNAARYSEGEIALRAALSGPWLQILVEDGGAPAPPALAGREGSGLGLQICRAVAAAFGGRLRIEAAAPRGTRALLELPLPPEEEPRA